MKIAIIGTGISGLVAAYRLHGDHQVTLYEANDYVGGHTNTIDVDVNGEHHAVDTGFIVFNDWTYPRFIELLAEHGVSSQATEMSFSVCDERSGLEYNGHSLNTLFAQRRNLWRPRFYRLIADIMRFNRQAVRLARATDDSTTVNQFLLRYGYSREFAEQYLLPMGAAIWSCPTGKFGRFPIRFIVEFYQNHGLLSIFNRPTWRVIRGGSRVYVEAMTRQFRDQIRLRCPVVQVQRSNEQVEIRARGAEPERFDHVVFACHSDQALRILGENATSIERELLSAFPYEKNVAILHTDVSVLPKIRKAWASWNYRLSPDSQAPATVTYNMNILQGIRSQTTFCVTLNEEARIAPEKTLRRFEYAHPVFTVARQAAQRRHSELVNANHTSFCGAYWRNGFHEDGVVSALAVVDALQRRNANQGQAKPIALQEDDAEMCIAATIADGVPE